MKKIMFNDRYGLTQAVLEGRKTMTRRTIPQGMIEKLNAKYKVGEVVAIAQTYKSIFEKSLNYALPRYHWLDEHIDEKGFANKMFVKAAEMPHHIKIVDIKVERLQDISEEDCLREGIQEYYPYLEQNPSDRCRTFQYFKDGKIRHRISGAPECFALLIDDICGKGTWEKNPLVFVYEFKLID